MLVKLVPASIFRVGIFDDAYWRFNMAFCKNDGSFYRASRGRTAETAFKTHGV